MSTATKTEPAIDQKIAKVKADANRYLTLLVVSVLFLVVFTTAQLLFSSPMRVWSLGFLSASAACAFVAIFVGARGLLFNNFTHRELLAKKYAR